MLLLLLWYCICLFSESRIDKTQLLDLKGRITLDWMDFILYEEIPF